ncbi:MAG: 4Fe-4S binding protein [Desulfobacteraceae bacterium]|jgi:ferredoxin/flavodoxin|nr:4Fe-4S binding protein [Desulfobacteraceae bacterium]
MPTNAVVLFISPAGSTRHVAGVIEDAAVASGAHVVTLDLKDANRKHDFTETIQKIGTQGILFVGSPVYRDMAVPPVMRFIESLPRVDGIPVAPFVTWGGAFSGVALWQMGQALTECGFSLVGGARVLGRHSMMWRTAEPVGAGHPDDDDDRLVADWVQTLFQRFQEGTLRPMAPAALDDHPPEHSASARARLELPWTVIPKTVNEEACTECGICRDECPTAAIVLDPTPHFTDACFDCFNCVRLCPEEAIEPAVAYKDIEKMILNRVRTFNETPPTRVYRNDSS